MNTEKLEEMFDQNATGFVVGHHVDRAIMKKPFLSLVTSPEFQQAFNEKKLVCENCGDESCEEYPVHHYDCGHSYCTYCTKDGCLCDCNKPITERKEK